MAVIIGIDPHKATHTAVAIDSEEWLLARLQLTAADDQTARLLAWATPLGSERTWAVESAGGLGKLLTQYGRRTRRSGAGVRSAHLEVASKGFSDDLGYGTPSFSARRVARRASRARQLRPHDGLTTAKLVTVPRHGDSIPALSRVVHEHTAHRWGCGSRIPDVTPSARWLEASTVRTEVFASQASRRGRPESGSREQPSAECHLRDEGAPRPRGESGIGQAGASTSAASAPNGASATRAPAAAIGPRGRRMQARQCRHRRCWSLTPGSPLRTQRHSGSMTTTTLRQHRRAR